MRLEAEGGATRLGELSAGAVWAALAVCALAGDRVALPAGVPMAVSGADDELSMP